MNSVSQRAMEQTARPGRATTLFQTSIYLALLGPLVSSTCGLGRAPEMISSNV